MINGCTLSLTCPVLCCFAELNIFKEGGLLHFNVKKSKTTVFLCTGGECLKRRSE